MASFLPIAVDKLSSIDAASIPGSPSSLFGEDIISVSSGKTALSNENPDSIFAAYRRGLGACPTPLEDLRLGSSPQSSLALKDSIHDAGSRLPPARISPDRLKNSRSAKTERGAKSLIQPGVAALNTHLEEVKTRKAMDQIFQDEQSPSKGSKVGERGDNHGHNWLFVTLSEAEDTPEEDPWVSESDEEPKVLHTRGRAKRIYQEPKIKKAGRARRRSTKSKSDSDERKILLDLGNWKEEERLRKGSVGTLDPIKIYYDIKDSIASDGDEDEDSNHTAAQVTLMILSLGSTKAIVDLKAIIKDMRGILLEDVVRPPVKFNKNLEEILKLVRWVFSSTKDGTPLDNFQSRYYISSFCHYIIGRRDHWIQKNGGKTAENAERHVYASLIARAYPDIPRFRAGRRGTVRQETSEFKEAVKQLQTKSKCGYHWLALREKFGIGIMALYYHSKLFSETAHISLDDNDLSAQEFNLLMRYLSAPGNAHSAWLKRLCRKINGHIAEGAKQLLTRPMLFVEKWGVEQIMACREQSRWLSMMCDTEARMTKRRGSKVTPRAWSRVGRATRIEDWHEKVESGRYGKVKNEAQP